MGEKNEAVQLFKKGETYVCLRGSLIKQIMGQKQTVVDQLLFVRAIEDAEERRPSEWLVLLWRNGFDKPLLDYVSPKWEGYIELTEEISRLLETETGIKVDGNTFKEYEDNIESLDWVPHGLP